MRDFITGFSPPVDLAGLNYWHFGTATQAVRDLLATH
jgi:hypothetical protein